eukprot:scaffold2131_cov113-Isochrysis_galbana.AAC.2
MATCDVTRAVGNLALLGKLNRAGIVYLEHGGCRLPEAQITYDLAHVGDLSGGACEAAMTSASVDESAMHCLRLLLLECTRSEHRRAAQRTPWSSGTRSSQSQRKLRAQDHGSRRRRGRSSGGKKNVVNKGWWRRWWWKVGGRPISLGLGVEGRFSDASGVGLTQEGQAGGVSGAQLVGRMRANEVVEAPMGGGQRIDGGEG